MPANIVSISGIIPDQDNILNDIRYIEEIFFNNSQPNTHLKASLHKQDASKNVPPETEENNESLSESKITNTQDNYAETKEVDSAQAEDTSRVERNEKQDPPAQQIYLRNVGDTINTVFHGSGSRHIQKAKRPCFVIYLKDGDGSLVFIVGTQFQEEITARNLKQGDRIKIEKTRQFKKARERSHARSAVFTITKL